MKQLQVLLADDHEMLLEGLRVLINSQPDMRVIAEASSGTMAVDKAKQCQPDVVVMDISMPDGNGLKATQILKQVLPQTRILVLTRHDEPVYMRQLLQAGVHGYMVKRAAANSLVSAIRTVAGGGVYVDPSLADRVVEGFVGRTSTNRTQEVKLSERETEVLRLTAWGHSNKEIASALRVGVKTIETYKARVMNKLGLQSRAEIVRYAVRQGWMDEN
jgi:DNA-binding NarL/FixJ family response regulator